LAGPRGGAWLSTVVLCVVVAAGACSVPGRDFASDDADSGGEKSMAAAGAAPDSAGAGGAPASVGDPQVGPESGGGAGGESVAQPLCEMGDTRACAASGLTGACAAGYQACEADGWGPCSIQPESEDGCEPGDNADCSGDANEGCRCIEGVTSRPCGPCRDGRQTCADGRADEYGPCEGATATPTVYYRDADGDGYGDATKVKEECSGQVPEGYVARPGDCCDDGGDKAVAVQINPGQTKFFAKPAGLCGITFDYNCKNGVETDPLEELTSCAGSCFAQYTTLREEDCGTYIGLCSCGGSGCSLSCGSGRQVTCR
jgi:hypothetical protein